MGLAWFDDEAPSMDERELRTGGLPLMPEGLEWPACPRCGAPLLFRAQVPLAMTSLTGFDDERLMLLFECYALGESGPCDGAAALLVDGELAPREAPASEAQDVILLGLGPNRGEVMRIVWAVSEWYGRGDPPLPRVVLHAAPRSIARETVRAMEEVGGRAQARPSAPTTLGEVHGGRLVPFDDGPRAMYRTTLPPLSDLPQQVAKDVMRGLIGRGTPGYRDHSFTCACSRPTRTAVRLIATREPSATGVRLGTAVAQICLPCNRAGLHRPHPGRGDLAVRLAC